MEVLGLGPGFARDLVRLERAITPPHARIGLAACLCFLPQQQALAALDAFSAHVHIWYPILRPGFTERYVSVLSGPLAPGPETCLVLSVAAVGALALEDEVVRTGAPSPPYPEKNSELYLEAATASLPAVLIDESIESIQALVLLSIYHCCLSRPCQAYDYAMNASFKVQNLLKCVHEVGKGDELYEQAKRCYWAVLLLESELRDQLDMVDSGIWNCDDKVDLPDSRRSWNFDLDAGSPGTTTASSPGSIISRASADGGAHASDRVQAYFLAEIAMRRMLHRCYTAIRRTPHGDIVYAPAIALELETQLDEWQSYLPDAVHFRHLAAPEPLSNFLRVQYYCCKMSIYWPAVYQCIQDGGATTPEILEHCERFFHAYMQSIPSLLTAVRDCIVNRWTLYATIFTTSMAVLQAAATPCLRTGCAVDWAHLLACLRSTRTVDVRIVQASPSLSLLQRTLADRLADVCPDVSPITAPARPIP
ncbi:aaeae85e-56e2-494d-863c-fdb28e7020da [Thermothielavioides terrestris]|uniref:Aaeae85e-56e2-494d-863c-fdb28e7020da n=1 Tax=Thermothielavioides terrestris TaxID=2587410 RepID=A0A446BP19_9PEZI|nr:aaeae85e-56e2-494d-863c-fdb28e7020da [Thermothielavioides terrestris]